ncbi:MAG: flavin reductase [Microbacterium sp.]|uniref:flavin reductase n=1 Tax=Microbacterium sp. TaxID=51671 RepID=UPI003A841E9D
MGAERIYHVAISDDWEMSVPAGSYEAATRGTLWEDGGYIRACAAEAIQSVLDARYADLTLPLLVVVLDAEVLRTEGIAVETDGSSARIYGALPSADHDAVVETIAIERAESGWLAPAGMVAPAPTHVEAHPSVLYVGTPAYLIGTTNDDGTPNLSPASSHFALGNMLVLGIETDSQTSLNLHARGELTVNFPSPDSWQAVVRLSSLTGRDPVPLHKARRYRYEPDKFGAAHLTAQASDLVAPPRVQECRLQFEAKVRRMTPGVGGGYDMVEAEVVKVHADPRLLRDRDGHLVPDRWHPLIYAFRHLFDRGPEVGWLASSPTAGGPPELD